MPSGSSMVADAPARLLARESRALVQRLRPWAPSRLAAAAPPWGSRADLVHHVAQAFADQAAESAGAPGRSLPRMDDDRSVADQLAVTSDDLLRSGAPDVVLTACAAHLLAHRHDLLGDAVPAGLATALGLPDVVAAGRAECRRSGSPAQ